MRQVIHRYVVPLGGVQQIEMPGGAVIVGAGYQPARDEFSVWARVPYIAGGDKVQRVFRVVGTGHEFVVVDGEEVRHIATVVMPDGFHVFHVMEIVGEATAS